MIINPNPAAVRIFAIFTLPAKASMPEIANGNINSQVIANAPAILDCSGIFGLMVVIPAKSKIPTITVASICAMSLSSNNLKRING